MNRFLANGQRTWHSVEQALRWIHADGDVEVSSNGLTKEICPHRSLAALKRAQNLTNDYTVSDIIESLKACRDPETGAYPSMNTGIILKGPLANGQRTWHSVEQTIRLIHQRDREGNFVRQSLNGLTQDNCPHRSLTALKRAHGLINGYTVSDIIESLRACRDPKTGRYPCMGTGIITAGPLANGERTWSSVDQAMQYVHDARRRGGSYNGLTKETCPWRTLAELKNANGLNDNSLMPVRTP